MIRGFLGYHQAKMRFIRINLQVILILLLQWSAYSQPTFQKERKTLQSSHASDSLKMDAAYRISKDICFIYPDSGIYYGHIALDYARKAKILRGEASSLNQIGYSYDIQERFDSAAVYWIKSVDAFKKSNDEFGAALVLSNVAYLYIFTGEFDKAKAMLEEVEATMVSLDSVRHNLATYTNFGLLYDIQGDYVEGQKYYLKAFEIAKKYEDTLGMASNINNIAVMYFYLDNFENTLKYSREALQYANTRKSMPLQAKIYINMALSFEHLHMPDSSIIYNKKALELNIFLKNDAGLAKIYHNLGCLYTDQGDLEKGLSSLLKAKEIKEKMGTQEKVGENG